MQLSFDRWPLCTSGPAANDQSRIRGYNPQKERTTFADGTTVTVDWTSNTVEITPELSLK
jgi:hypothetical protein